MGYRRLRDRIRDRVSFYSYRDLSASFRLFFFNDPATTEIYTLSLHDALPISVRVRSRNRKASASVRDEPYPRKTRSEEHTSELQSPDHLVCRLLLEKKKTTWMPAVLCEGAFVIRTDQAAARRTPAYQ